MMIVGVDCSYTGLGLVAVPGDWGLDFGRVKRVTLTTGPETGPLVARAGALTRDACRWVEWARGPEQISIYIEAGLSRASRGDQVRPLNRLIGVVEHELYKLFGVVPVHAEQTALRKLLLGFEPPRDKKAAVVGVLELLTPTRWDPNEYDAFASANYGLAEQGLAFVTVAKEAA